MERLLSLILLLDETSLYRIWNHGIYFGGMCFYLGNGVYTNRAGYCSDKALGLYSGDVGYTC
jgi:hypothetical protein